MFAPTWSKNARHSAGKLNSHPAHELELYETRASHEFARGSRTARYFDSARRYTQRQSLSLPAPSRFARTLR